MPALIAHGYSFFEHSDYAVLSCSLVNLRYASMSCYAYAGASREPEFSQPGKHFALFLFSHMVCYCYQSSTEFTWRHQGNAFENGLFLLYRQDMPVEK